MQHAIGSLDELKKMNNKVVLVTPKDGSTPEYAMVSGPVRIPDGTGYILRWESRREKLGRDRVTDLTPSFFERNTFRPATKAEVGYKRWSPIST